MFDSLYKPYDDEIAAFGDQWCGPEKYVEWEEMLVARYVAGEDSDGQTVEVYCQAAPARFYIMKVLAGVNPIKEPLAPYEVSTGSGQAQLSADIARAISEGMLGFSLAKEASKNLAWTEN